MLGFDHNHLYTTLMINISWLFPAKATSAGPAGPPQLGRVHPIHQPLEATGGTSL